MNFDPIIKTARAFFDQAEWIAHIHNQQEYEMALSLMDELIEDYDENIHLIELLSLSIERWEDQDKSFRKFNKAVQKIDTPVAVLRVLMDQYHLGVSDFPEIGSKSLVSKILNHQRRLTADHIHALCERFKISPVHFFDIWNSNRHA